MHTQASVLAFLRAGGSFTPSHVAYRDVELPRALFGGTALGGVGYLMQVVDYGAKIAPVGSDFLLTLPNGLRIQSGRDGFIDAILMVVERFIADEYGWLDPKGKVVIDVGANIGDSTLYFAQRGAAFVYGYEPAEAAFAAAERNLALNGIANARMIKAAVGSGLSLPQIVGRATTEHPGLQIVCKVDCEGCEFEILGAPDAGAALIPVLQLMIEYHWRSPAPVVDVLRKSGFEVETSPTAPGVGWIRARRILAA